MASRRLQFISDDYSFDELDSDIDSEFDPSNEAPDSDSEDDIANIATTTDTTDALTPPTTTSTPLEPNRIEKCRSRKRKRNLEEWSKNKASKAYNSGHVYKRKGVISKRKVGDRCLCKKRNCQELSDEERQSIHDGFWTLTSQNKRANYIIAHTSTVTKKRAVLEPAYNRGDNKKYFLPRSNGEKLEVCKRFFQSTLCISDKMISYNLKKSVNGIKPPTTRPAPSNKLSPEAKKSVIDHIKSYPVIESHYCRSSTYRTYIDPTLNKTKMFQMYKESEFCNTAVKLHYYSRVFDEEFNIGFHKPSKDACDTCDKYTKSKAAGTVTAEMETDYAQHIRRKQQAREAKEHDKTSPNAMTVTCDLQQVMTAPRFFAGSTYYKRKLNVFNFTVYELPTGDATCFTWTEAECQRGANDIASCLIKYLEKVDEAGKYSTVIIYSDTCGGQNRNRIVCTAIASFLSSAKVVKRVEQKFFESGHSHMECDSMHSAIEATFRSIEVALPSDYISCIARARTKTPYKIVEMTHDMVADYGLLNDHAFKKDAFKGIMKAHYIRYTIDDRNDISITMAEEISGPEIEVSWRKRGNQKSLAVIQSAYDQPCGIDKDKKADLLSMVEFAPSKLMYKLYYENLSVKN